MTDGNTVQENESVQAPSTSTQQAPSQQDAAVAKTAVEPSAKHGALRRFFWMDERVAEAKSVCFTESSPGFAEFSLAKQARAGIVQIGETGESNSAVLMLERIEVLSLLRSYLLKHQLPCVGVGQLTAEDLAQVRTLPRIHEAWNELSTAQQSAVEAALGPHAESGIAGLDTKNRRYLASALRKLSGSLSEPLEFEANRVGRVLFVRWARIGAAGLAALGVVLACYGAYAKATAKPNLALHRPVTVSTQSPNEGKDHDLLVDGDRSNLGFHTESGSNQWCAIDLGAIKPIAKIVVSNRADCCQDRAIPLHIEISDDGANYRTIAKQTDQFDTWTADKLNTKGRYVKVVLDGTNYFLLSEVEVY